MDNNEEVTDVRTDLWGTMNLRQLNSQRDLVVSKMGLLQNMLSTGGNPNTLTGLYKALEYGLEVLNHIIDERSKQ